MVPIYFTSNLVVLPCDEWVHHYAHRCSTTLTETVWTWTLLRIFGTVCSNSQGLFSAMSCLLPRHIPAPDLLTVILFPGVLVLVETHSVTETSGTSPLRSYWNTIIATGYLGNTSRTVWFLLHMHHQQEITGLRTDHFPTAKEDRRLNGSHHTCNERQKKQYTFWLKVPGRSCPHWMTALMPDICICCCVETGGNNCYIPAVYISWISPWLVDPYFHQLNIFRKVNKL